jgi:hypothetical protein
MSIPRHLVLPALFALLWQVPAAAQFPPLTVPRGLFRAELTGTFASASQRLRNGETEPLGADFVRNALDSDFFGGLETADDLLQSITQLPDARINLGASSASHQVTVGTAGIGLAYGLTGRITLFGHLPIVRVKVRSTFDLVGDGTAGFNPADPLFGTPEGETQSVQFFLGFDAALSTLEQKIAAGDYDADPAQRALAEATLASGTTLRNNLHALVLGTGTASPFLPVATSPVGAAVLSEVTGLQTILSTDLGVAGFANLPALPEAPLTSEEFDGFISNPAGPVAGSLATPSLGALGDAEVGVAITLADGLTGSTTGRGVRLAAQGLVRLPTSFLSDNRRFFDVGTGDKQTDVEGTMVLDLVAGKFGARAMGSYTLQMAGTAERRITRPDQPIALASRLARVSRNPGDLISVGFTPMFRLADRFGLMGGVAWRRKGSDAVTLAGGQDPLPDASPDLLAIDTDGSWTTATAGLLYTVPMRVENGKTHMPLDAGVAWESVINASGPLRVAKTATVRFWLRVYGRL